MKKWVVCCFAAAWMFSTGAGAEGVKNTRTSLTYSTITGAVAAAVNDDSLLLTTGRFSEVVSIGAKNLTLVGRYNSTFTVQLPGGTTLVAPASNLGSVFVISNSTVTLDSLDISGGAPALKLTRVHGGGLRATDSSIVTANVCRIFGNQSGGMGGGLYATNSRLALVDTLVFSNSAVSALDAGHGGGVAVVGGSLLVADDSQIDFNVAEDSGGGVFLRSARCDFSNAAVSFNVASNNGGGLWLSDHVQVDFSGGAVYANHALASGSLGGGFYAVNYSNLTMNGTWIASNSAGYGGGAFLSGGVLHGTGTFFNVLVENNQACEGGGGFYIDSAASLRLRSGLVFDNDADSDDSDSGDGGAIFVTGQGSVDIEPEAADVLIFENTAWNGGAIAIDDEGSASLVSTQEFAISIYDNTAHQFGGGVALPQDYGILEGLGRVLLHGNTASESGGGVYQNGGLVHLEGLADRPFIVSSNTTTYYHGGGFCAEQSALLQLVNVQIGAPGAGNRAGYANMSGGGIALLDFSNLQATNIAVQGNVCNRFGAGLYVSNAIASVLGIPGDPAVDISPPNRIIGNQATNATLSAGGGIYVVNGILTLHDAVVASNSARNGGGLYFASASTNRVINCVVATNVVTLGGGGGGAYMAATANAQWLHCTVSRNSEGGMAAAGGAPVCLTNCIVNANANTNLPAGLSVVYSLVEPPYPGVGNFVGDPLFMDPAALDYRLTYGSVATNRGVTLPRVARDAIGNARPASAAYDPGAFEYDWTVMDSDGDLIPDDWEVERDLNPHSFDSQKDDDHDTHINLDEYIADTDPQVDTDFFQVAGIQTNGNQAEVLADTSARRQYRMEYLDDLSGTWQTVPGRESFGGAGGSGTIPDARPLQPNRNYRLNVWIP